MYLHLHLFTGDGARTYGGSKSFVKCSVQYRFRSINLVLQSKYTRMCLFHRLERLRRVLRERNLYAYIIPTSDAHNSEYVAACDARREYLTGFTGSAGTAVVTPSSALLWTDGRYYVQAEQELSKPWVLMRQGLPNTPSIVDYLHKDITKRNSPSSFVEKRIGADPRLFTTKAWEEYKKKQIQLVPVTDNLVDVVRKSEDSVIFENSLDVRNQIHILSDVFTGKSMQAKLKYMHAEMLKLEVDYFVLSALDDIAWITNLRGNDIPYNPVFFSYAVIRIYRDKPGGELHLFLDKAKLSPDIQASLQGSGNDQEAFEIHIHAYDHIANWLESELRDLTGESCKVRVAYDPLQTSYFLSHIIDNFSRAVDTLEVPSIAMMAKSVKNESEVEGFRASHIEDGVAVTRYLYWLEKRFIPENMTKEISPLTEFAGAEQLRHFRSLGIHYLGLSFPTISAAGENSAVIHYSPPEVMTVTQSLRSGDKVPENPPIACITNQAIYLVDSGGQYLNGTTDVTRTVHLGNPTEQEKEAYTLVLKGNIALQLAIFPSETTSGHALDVLARQFLWRQGYNYAHGTGHGVGHYLNVHEGPMSIAAKPGARPNVVMRAGNVLSNEPGCYLPGQFGIRIENLMAVVARDTKYGHSSCETATTSSDRVKRDAYLGFEVLTMVPLCRCLIATQMLTEEERTWVDSYHETVLQKIGEKLQEKKLNDELQWLKDACLPLT